MIQSEDTQSNSKKLERQKSYRTEKNNSLYLSSQFESKKRLNLRIDLQALQQE